MSTEFKIKCDYSGYCGKQIDAETKSQEGWFEIEASHGGLSVRRLAATDKVKTSGVTHGCPRHADKVAADAAGDLKIFEKEIPDAQFPEVAPAPPPDDQPF